MAYYVYSTLATNQEYAAFAPAAPGTDLPLRIEGVLITGKVGVANRNLITPRGAVTTITDEQHARLVEDPVFRLHRDNGYIVVDRKHTDPEAVSANMSAADPSRPKEPGDFDLDATAPKVSAGEKKARGK
jgi:hypothetical protein